MHLPATTIKLLDLQPAEVAVLRALSTKPQLSSRLQRATAIPRVTLDRTLEGLRRRGLIRREKFSPKRYGWLLKSVTEIKIIDSRGSTAVGSEVVIYEGKEQLLNATLRFIEMHAGERALAVQSNKTWDIWTSELTREDFDRVNSLLRRKMVIMETISREFFNFYSDLTICRDAVFIMNWRDSMGIEIRNADIVSLFTSLFRYVQATAERVNVHEVHPL